VSLNALFFPKARALLLGEDVDENLGISKRRKPNKNRAEAVHPEDDGLMEAGSLKGKSSEEKIIMCKKQIHLWQAKLMKVGEKSNSMSSHSSHSTSSAHATIIGTNESLLSPTRKFSFIYVPTQEELLITNFDNV